MAIFERLARLAAKLRKAVRPSLPTNWAIEKDDEKEDGSVCYRLEAVDSFYIVSQEWDRTWAWVKVEASTGRPLDMACGLPSLEAAKTHVERHRKD